ncbi:tubulin epsilon and delta complex protein 1 isoform X2 [Neoarius graeffei]|uniref:tubulin epsilon and delta complex protein 1 isoform X2 n=1 Tax=Neoarius graeffei TaxID=443677 RepID=UPI00298C0864|nr:tubulin epsilon and delta complex protein 1 isoform X2 [Neoarius graeffei]
MCYGRTNQEFCVFLTNALALTLHFHFKMQKKDEECSKNIKVKEVITVLCKCLSVLDVESVPPAEVFRRAKFNKIEAVQDLWCLLRSLLMKGFELDCACSELTKRSTSDTQFCFVKSALWHSGYGAWWVVGPWACENGEIGSRDLLLAFSWLIASGNLLEALLQERLLHLDILSSAAGGLLEELELDLNEYGRKDVRRLQWQYGKLKLQWRSLLTAQQEQAKLIEKVCSHMSSPSTCYPSAAHVPHLTGSTALEKDLKRIQSLNGILEAYLEWKNVEPMFWCWMDSVVDGYLIDRYQEGSVELLQTDQAVTCSCSHGDQAWRSVRCLDKMLLRLQAKHQDRSERCTDTTELSHRQKGEVERRVSACLQGFSLVNTLTTTDRGFTPYFQELQTSRSTCKPHRGDSDQAGLLQASSVCKELRHRKAILEWEMKLLRQSQREEMQSKANTLEGLVFILPLKR